MDDITLPQFKPGDRCFSHYTRHIAAGVSGWGTIVSLHNTDRGRTHGVTGSKLDDTTWYDIISDEGEPEYLDDAHGNWDMARIIPPAVAKRFGYGEDPARFFVEGYTARMTGAFWWIVTDGRHGAQADGSV
jgi:hypothetical protein